MKTVIGVTGGTGSGKTSFAAALASEGAMIIDADQIGRSLLVHNVPVKERLKEEFGPSILTSSGEVSRGDLAEIVFKDYKKLKKLNGLVHPPMIRKIHGRLADYYSSAESGKLCVIDMALLFELYIHHYCDKAIYLSAPESSRIDWLKKERGWNLSQIRGRIGSQMAEEEKAEAADMIIMNDSTLESLRKKAVDLHRSFV